MKIFKYIMFFILCSTILIYFIKQYNTENNFDNGIDNLIIENNKSDANDEALIETRKEDVIVNNKNDINEDAVIASTQNNQVLNNKEENEKNNKQSSAKIKVFKSQRILELYNDNVLIGKFKIALGKASEGDKTVEGDYKTPVGNYYICTRNDKSKFTLFLGISYPSSKDAKRGLNNNLIDQNTANKIIEAERLGICPPWYTPLGGEVGIHGGGNENDWTRGCIALSDDDIRIIWDYASMNTPVEIYE